MAQAPDDEEEEEYEYEAGKWEWDDPDHGGWAKFDSATSTQIEDKLKEYIDEGPGDDPKKDIPISVKLNKGSWFGQSKNADKYQVDILFGWSGNTPVIRTAAQSNVQTKYRRSIRRVPPLDPPLTAEAKQIQDKLKGTWEWKDDYGWKKYELVTQHQIEAAYQERQRKVKLTSGPYFSSRPNQYVIEFNFLSSPASAQQQNAKTRYGRWVRRTPHESEDKKKEKKGQKNFMLKKNPHFLMMQHYAPLSKEDFEDQKNDEVLKQNLKCPICLSDFEEKNLLENQLAGQENKLAVLGKKEVEHPDEEDDAKDNDEDEADKDKGDSDEKEDAKEQREKANLKRHHKFTFGNQAKPFVTDETIVGLNKGNYGLYYKAGCILEALNNKIECPVTKQAYGDITGNQPEGRLYVTKQRAQCSGCKAKDSVKMLFEFPGGIQGKEHPNPGKNYFGDLREAYFPNDKEGRMWAMLVRLAFERKLMFSIGTSQTLKADNRIVFGSIHLKTSTIGGTEKHGYPDENYFANLKKELAVKNITEANVEKMDQVIKDFIEKGFPEDQ